MELRWLTYFCDRVSTAPYEKINIEGRVPFNSLAIAHGNYVLDSFLVVEGFLSHPPKEGSLVVRIEFKEGQSDSVLAELGPQKFQPKPDQARILLAFQLAGTVVIPGPGRLSVQVFLDESLVCTDHYRVVIGDAPSVHLEGTIPRAGLVGPGQPFDLPAIVRRANKELVVMDRYLRPADLDLLLSPLPDRNIPIRIVAGLDRRQEYEQHAIKLYNDGFQNLVAQFSDKVHDRYVLVNREEVFHFGTSLQSLGDKWASCRRITDWSEHAGVLDLFSTTWAATAATAVSMK